MTISKHFPISVGLRWGYCPSPLSALMSPCFNISIAYFCLFLGPLTKNVNGKATLVGIVSWASDPVNCPPEYPIVFTDIFKYTDWIHEKMMTHIP